MCIGDTGSRMMPLPFIRERRKFIKRYKLRVNRLRSSTSSRRNIRERIRSCDNTGDIIIKREKEMEMKNLKLYMENMSILEANDKLRKKAAILYQENVALMSEFNKKFDLRPITCIS